MNFYCSFKKTSQNKTPVKKEPEEISEMKRGRFQKAARRKKRDVALKMFSNSKNVTSIGIVSWGRWDGSPARVKIYKL